MQDTGKIVELIDKVIQGLNNEEIVAGKNGVEIDGFGIDSIDASLKGELYLIIQSNKRSEPVMIMSYDYPELKDKMIELRDAIKDSNIRKLNKTIVDPFIQALDKIHNQRNMC